MSQVLIAVSEWLHALATVIFIGHYVLLALIYLPALTEGPQSASGTAISAISKRSRTWLYASLLVFAVTGIYLMLVNQNYKGLGNFSNLWSILMLVKHTVVFVMLVLGFWFNAVQRIGLQLVSNTGATLAIARFRTHAITMAVLGVAVLLLTSLAQVQ